MELIDDWDGKYPKLATVAAIGAQLATLDLSILTVHCYVDVRYPWVQVVFDQIVHPDVVLHVGDALVAQVGADRVYFNSLRPKAVYFLLDPGVEKNRDLPASRYGASLADMHKSWARADEKAPSRVAAQAVTAHPGALPTTGIGIRTSHV